MEQLDISEKDTGTSDKPQETAEKPLAIVPVLPMLGIGKGNNPNSIAALKHYQPGQSGNPSGRPRKITNALDKALNRRRLKAMAEGIIGQATKGDVAAFTAIADRVEGKVAQPHTGEEGGPMQIEIITRIIGQK